MKVQWPAHGRIRNNQELQKGLKNVGQQQREKKEGRTREGAGRGKIVRTVVRS